MDYTLENLNIGKAGEIPMPDMPLPPPEAKGAEFGELPCGKSRVELELLRRFDPETVTAVDEQGKEYKGMGEVLPLFLPKEGEYFAPTRNLLMKDGSGVTWGARTGSSYLRLSEKPIGPDYPLKEAEFSSEPELDPAERYVLDRWGRDGLSRAVDLESGKEYKGYEAIIAAMKQDDRRLALYETTNRDRETGQAKEKTTPYIFQNKTKRMDDGYVTDRELLISDGQVKPNEKYTSLTLEQEQTIRRIADICDAKRDLNTDFRPFALDDEGNMYRSPEEMTKKLFANKWDGRIFLFTNKGQAPYCLKQGGGHVTMSEERITPENQLERDKEKRYTPAASLDPHGMAVSGKQLHYVMEKRSKVNEHLKRYIPNMREDARLKGQDEAKFFNRKENKAPPRLGFFATIGNWFSKTFTGKPSKAYEAYNQRKADYQKHVETREMLDQRNKALDEAEARDKKLLEQLDKEIDPLREEYSAKMHGGAAEREREIQTYRGHTEVLMAGVADLQEKGKVTQGNIFAYSWLQNAACKGKGWEDMEAVKSLYNFISARMVQDKILGATMANPESDPQSQALVNCLNDGSAVEALMKDNDLRAVLSEYKGPIDPDKIYGDYLERVETRNKEATSPEARLQEARQELLARYGDKPVTQEALVDIMRLNNLDRYITASRMEAPPRDREDKYYYDLVGSSKDGKKDIKAVGHIAADMYKAPRETKVIHPEDFMGPEYQKALKGVMLDSAKKLEEAREKVRRETAGLPDSVRSKMMPKGNMGLEQLAELVNTAVKNKTYADLALDPEPVKAPEGPARGL